MNKQIFVNSETIIDSRAFSSSSNLNVDLTFAEYQLQQIYKEKCAQLLLSFQIPTSNNGMMKESTKRECVGRERERERENNIMIIIKVSQSSWSFFLLLLFQPYNFWRLNNNTQKENHYTQFINQKSILCVMHCCVLPMRCMLNEAKRIKLQRQNERERDKWA